MINGNLIIKRDSYCNDNAIENAINYISRLKDNELFFYGVWPPTQNAAIFTFEKLRQTFPMQTCSKQVQHFIISFNALKDINLICRFAEQIAFFFAPTYPACFSLHDDTKHLHVHFIVSTTSHLPNHAPFVDELWDCYYTHLLIDFAFKQGISLQEVRKDARTI